MRNGLLILRLVAGVATVAAVVSMGYSHFSAPILLGLAAGCWVGVVLLIPD